MGRMDALSPSMRDALAQMIAEEVNKRDRFNGTFAAQNDFNVSAGLVNPASPSSSTSQEAHGGLALRSAQTASTKNGMPAIQLPTTAGFGGYGPMAATNQATAGMSNLQQVMQLNASIQQFNSDYAFAAYPFDTRFATGLTGYPQYAFNTGASQSHGGFPAAQEMFAARPPRLQ